MGKGQVHHEYHPFWQFMYVFKSPCQLRRHYLSRIFVISLAFTIFVLWHVSEPITPRSNVLYLPLLYFSNSAFIFLLSFNQITGNNVFFFIRILRPLNSYLWWQQTRLEA